MDVSVSLAMMMGAPEIVKVGEISYKIMEEKKEMTYPFEQ